ncbi:hypothetical protein [Schwartzia sp. (in: firmicutes)]|nr:hypothetical protein [Schwartzia sp. (in: firmicutes)]
MAKQFKRIRKNINAAHELEEEDKLVEAPKPRPWENIILVVVICLTLFLLASGWDMMDNWNRGMYASLAAALILMYVQRKHADKLSASVAPWLNRGIFLFISLSLCLFGCVIYLQHFAS